VLGDPHAVLVIDESSFRKRGKKSAGVPGSIVAPPAPGKLSGWSIPRYTSSKGHTLLDRELYLPMRWIKDRKRCERLVSRYVRFQTKCEQARK